MFGHLMYPRLLVSFQVRIINCFIGAKLARFNVVIVMHRGFVPSEIPLVYGMIRAINRV